MDNSYAVTADFYDFVSDYRTRPDVSFFVDLARQSNGPVLELGCGTGRVLIPTARAGIDVVGVDLSPHMLAVCERRLRDEPSEVQSCVQLIQADIRDFELSQKLSLVTIPFRPFQHLMEVTDQLACLECVRRHLDNEGRLVLDVFNPSLTSLTQDNLGAECDEGPDFDLPDGRRVVRKVKIIGRDLVNQVLSIELIYYVKHPDGRNERLVHAFEMRYFFRYEMEHLLARAGLMVEALYGDYQRNHFSVSHSGDLVFVTRQLR